MLIVLLLVVLSLAMLYFGAEWLLAGSSALARRLGVSALVIGLTVVSYGTSFPELLVSVQAAWAGLPDIAVGNVVGSNIFNVAVILALAAIISAPKVDVALIRRDAPLMIGVVLVAVLMLLDGRVGRLEGLLLFSGVVAYTWASLWASRREEKASAVAVDVTIPQLGWLGLGWRILAGLALLGVGSNLLVLGSTGLANAFGVSEAIIGLTIVSAGTSMPELATSILGAMRGHSALAIGNVIGSNIFNILCILGLTAMILPLEAGGITQLDLWTMLVVCVLVWPIIWSGRQISRAEGGLLLGIYAIYLGALLWK